MGQARHRYHSMREARAASCASLACETATITKWHYPVIYYTVRTPNIKKDFVVAHTLDEALEIVRKDLE